MSLPPAIPVYVLRGHSAQVHSTTFIRANTRLVTGDADGWVVLWNMATKRPAAVWHAHEGAILASVEWGRDFLITHGKDNKLIVWKLTEQDESDMSVSLPVDDTISHRLQPWVRHVLQVNTLNFCSFAHCKSRGQLELPNSTDLALSGDGNELLIAVPNAISSESVDIFHLPSEQRLHTVRGDENTKTGMVMAVSIFYQGIHLTIATGFESGHTSVSQLVDGHGWHILYMAHPHSQPVLSLAVDSNCISFISSSADAIIAKNPIPTLAQRRNTSSPASPPSGIRGSNLSSSGPSLLSKGLVAADSQENTVFQPPKAELETKPLKIVQTKHSGQQGLKIRSDGKVFATAGWDSRVRVYSVQSLKELAVLKWHKEGCYAIAFSNISNPTNDMSRQVETNTSPRDQAITSTTSSVLTVREKRTLRAITTHWLAAGSKDGKVSLWDIY